MKQTKARRRVAVARDALRQVQAKKMVATSGLYAQLGKDVPLNAINDGKEFQKFVKHVKCQVCARGALFISTVRKEDSFAPGQAFRGIARATIDTRLLGLFSSGQLEDIEDFFEGGGASIFPDDTGRLVAILKNIIKNKGTFVAPKG